MVPSSVGGDAPIAELVPHIRLRGVSKVLRTERGAEITALTGIDLDIDNGSFVAVVGPSGCGKTTLLNQIAGLAEPTEGEISVRGRPVRGPGRDRGMVFQADALFFWRTVRRNVEYGLETQGLPRAERKEYAEKYLKLVGLMEFADLYPKELSGGMKKRCQIATVLANSPEVLLMDEPFGALDYPTKCQLQEQLLNILAREPKATVFVTHDIEEALFLADRIVVMGKGSIRRIVDVPFTKPRASDLRVDAKFAEQKAELWRALEGWLTAADETADA
ncbi:MAG: ABC transporter ATP-binding protein [Albidovulum sp.]|nr:ABC transporter ATP-binding protein [Albidovulum sp.]